jgi:hypothetical protein
MYRGVNSLAVHNLWNHIAAFAFNNCNFIYLYVLFTFLVERLLLLLCSYRAFCCLLVIVCINICNIYVYIYMCVCVNACVCVFVCVFVYV